MQGHSTPSTWPVLVLLFVFIWFASADLPAHCLLRDVVGEWEFHIGPAVQPAASAFTAHPAVIPSCGHHIPNTVLSMLALNSSSEVPAGGSERVRFNLTDTIAGPPRRLHVTASVGGAGAWTMMFDEGFEVRMDSGRSFFAHFYFESLPNASRMPSNGDRWDAIAQYYGRDADQVELKPEGDLYACHCERTSVGWWHQWKDNRLESGCFWASKVSSQGSAGSPHPSLIRMVQGRKVKALAAHGLGSSLLTTVAGAAGNATDAQSLGQSMFTGKQVLRGQPAPGGPTNPQVEVADAGAVTSASPVPEAWDWREQMRGMWLDGTDGLSAQFSQGNCGSCYAFSGALVLQMRFRIQLLQRHGILYPLELSWKSATRCSPYTEGCNGGFAYLTFKYAAEAGLPTADCDKAEEPANLDTSCDWSCYGPETMVFYAKDYGQTGGFAHGASEESIMREIHKNGPVIVSFSTKAAPEFIYNNGESWANETEVMTKFLNHTMASERSSKNPAILPWYYTTHSILAVGWGQEDMVNGDVVKYWIVRNSWGTEWGENGYAKIRRGYNDAALETSAPWVEPDMDRLPQGFLDIARRRHEELVAARRAAGGSAKAAAPPESSRHLRSRTSGGRRIPTYCKLRPTSPDCS